MIENNFQNFALLKFAFENKMELQHIYFYGKYQQVFNKI